MKINRFIGGPGRSNTTILGKMLSRFEDVIWLDETPLIRYLFSLKADIAWNSLIYEARMINQMCVTKYKENAWYEINNIRNAIWISSLTNKNPFQMREQVLNLEKKIENTIDNYFAKSHKIIDEYLSLTLSWLPPDKKNVFKDPGMEIYLNKIATLEDERPESWRLIYTTKNIFEIATSWFKTQMFPGEDFHNALDRLEERIIHSCLAVRSLPQSSVLFISDNDLAHDLESTVKKIAEYMEIKYNPESLKLWSKERRVKDDGSTDQVISRFRKRIETIQRDANHIFGKNIW
jgi:hypothetical protein